MLTADELAERTTRAVASAAAAGRDLGLEVSRPRVLYDVFSVIVHLEPSPVVVRVPTVLPPSYSVAPEAQTAQQRSELAVAGWLADRGHPVVPPSPLVPREPVRREGFSMTFWELVDEVADDAPDMLRRIGQIAQLHAALRDYEGDGLGFWTPFGTYIPEGLAELAHMPELLDPADLRRAQREWAVLSPVLTSRAVFQSTFPGAGIQAIHGDAPYANMIRTPDGELWSDFELVTLGAVESDLAMVGPEGVAAYNVAASRLGLRPVDERVLRVTEAAGRLAMVAALAMAPNLPLLVDGLRPMVEQWRATPEVTEV
ncbi:aminoglycoside phosphotransferase family protein [Mycobacterium deserti]|uniref:Aminoglycoside phosphotransferase family protein n=1 Tax=Mycobacterium deserti TaxID=2978347 RepID=A0ABT2MA69_9MYCO|nr:aminoglycoside phosphotransferase family protein [Mycobacterium deserti]MCT7657901.1 aminoglycoside phosphotransferase family protein [Mycobacterium deserti]